MEKISKEDVLKSLGNMSVMQIIALTKQLEKEWGVKAEPPAVQYQAPPTDTVKKVEQTEFNLILMAVPADKKMSAIKMVREVLNLPLKESKELVESAPKLIRESVSKEEADEIVSKFATAGATIEVK